MHRQAVSRALDQVIFLLTLAFGIVFVLSEVFVRGVDLAVIEWADLAFTWAFLTAFALQFALTHDRWGWLKTNWIDVLIIVAVAFPLLRLLRFYRYLPLVRTGRLIRVAAILGEALRAHLRTYGRGNLYNVLVAGLVLIFLGAILVQFAEDAPESNIKTFGDAIWWAVTTVTTVGYGDKFPVTPAGRVLAAGLMVLGIGLFGVMTGSLSSFFLAQTRESETARLQAEILGLRQEVALLANGSRLCPRQRHE